ncbi:XkdF-like putative serine protease domain-containing protein [Geobacillus stearothermophilus]|uniref:XkdF-like putative serine protease domain-containing protein n=1 Tax=Geobacillus stearothermophilus TaxID=1422 RepID=UPI0006AC6866|nr:XkdF-like putative serine protease domain-containing protein [Geobacillus stearothermophilus]KOR93965.1 structural protein [Geobacillus stearothermophilus ATCC 12980]MED3843324.1 XkdF-like putative serine protease domain-containing protein [Geobacillus stearothermophilus]MED4356545.1 XkdF-like putative serine protease domain-containing protein [Geobacillus stearothermophilus]MED4881324.1 XkdF-like putative serine protease domain-containing protein [Geobacillus stearothermophilus]MED5010916.
MKHELTAPVTHKNEEKRIVFGPVLVPNEPDSDGDVVSAEKIEEVAHKFLEQYGNIDLQHTLNNVGKVVESYILPFDWEIDDELTVPKGSWMMGVRVQDEDVWQAVKEGKLTGFSIMGVPKAALKSKEALKRTTLADLERSAGDWVVNAVSLVDEPAVPKAKFIAIKSKDNREEAVKKAIQGSFEYISELLREKVYQTFDNGAFDSYVYSIFEDSIVIRVDDLASGKKRFFQIGYTINEQGDVEFVGDLQEVRIVENIVPVESPSPQSVAVAAQAALGDEQSGGQGVTLSNEETSPQRTNKSLFDRFKEKLGLKPSGKAGRKISDANYEKLKAAKEVIDELLRIAEEERANKSKEGDDEVKVEDVQKMIDDSLKPVNDKLSEIMSTLKGAATDHEPQEPQNEEEGLRDESAAKSEDDSYKEKYEQVVKQLDELKRKIPFSKRLTGQDGVEKSKPQDEYDRDPFGFKRK